MDKDNYVRLKWSRIFYAYAVLHPLSLFSLLVLGISP